ncbi:uncharacterized protein TRIADDRAFT_64272 [Trichoplax adhaerens]|uniref:Uncharacterized protein n=1 Tax=Trichoplax adhaerens TaxID=10228 RepID=B3S846_TRIAD|nr:predicted protein [Trichoplax adhaerens]EDV21134.1 predicted protein [Trichoplax adhaerens]|eukprot:XP_002116464.1 predicted protein [Trichoplax adhaerens]
MYNPRKLSIIVYIGAVAMLFGGLFTYISNQVMMRSCENIFMIDLGLMGLLALTLATALLKVNDLATTSTTQASGLTALAVIISAASPAILARLVIAFFSSAVLFATGILGLIAHEKQVVDLGVWTKTFTNFTAGISAASTIAMVQTLVRYANQPGDTKWERFDFTILTLCQTLFTFIGLILSSVAIVATDDVLNKAPKPTKSSDIDTMNVGMLVSASVAGAVAIFNMAIMNYPVYGFPPVAVAIMVIVTARHGIDIQTTDNGIAKYPYYVLSVFNSFGSIWAISMSVYEFLAHASYQTSLLKTFFFFRYAFGSITILSLIPVAYFSIKAAIRSSKDVDNLSNGSIPIV